MSSGNARLRHLSFEGLRSRDGFAMVAKRRYRTSMNISRLLLAIFFSATAALAGNDELKERLQPALEAITPDGLLAHIKVLASDEFEGRDRKSVVWERVWV